MTDIHTHILPGMDDGSRSIEESLALLRAEAAQGITEVVLTPHFYASQHSPAQFLKRRQQAWEQLRPHLTGDLPRVRLGAEVQYFEGICAVPDLGSLRIQGSSLLLLEMPLTRWTERMLRDLLTLNRRKDTQVLLAHVERYLPLQPWETFLRLLEAGILFQSNVSFFLGWRTRFRARQMLRRGQIHIIGSDCHREDQRPPQWSRLPRGLRMKLWQTAWDFSETHLSPCPAGPTRPLAGIL